VLLDAVAKEVVDELLIVAAVRVHAGLAAAAGETARGWRQG
jgi:hypothetical protein